ncbi:MAG: glycosyltransferase family 9 protein [Sediminibacterium sp.]|nr:glycosyltransferase family 9 protein [Sediminibacterium sp.]
MRRILIIQTAFIGDVVLATSLLEALHQHFPKAKLDMLVRGGNEGLLKNHPFLNKVWVWNKKQEKYKNLFKLIKKVRSEHFDLVVNVQRYWSTGLLTALSGAKQTVGFDKNPFSFLFTYEIEHRFDAGHEIDRNHQLIDEWVGTRVSKPALYPSKTDFENIKSLQLGPYICMAPSSVWFTKQWPKHKWVELIDLIPASFHVYLLGAPGDRQLCEEIQHTSKHKQVHNLSGQLSFLESAALMQGATMNYVNDSAPMHFASAMDAPVTAIYCSTVPSFGYGPLSRNQHIIEVIESLSCRPCGLHGKKACPKGHFDCAEKIDPMLVLSNSIPTA